MTNAIVQIHNVSKKIGAKTIIDQLISEGEI
jgi:hypothetical protein